MLVALTTNFDMMDFDVELGEKTFQKPLEPLTVTRISPFSRVALSLPATGIL